MLHFRVEYRLNGRWYLEENGVFPTGEFWSEEEGGSEKYTNEPWPATDSAELEHHFFEFLDSPRGVPTDASIGWLEYLNMGPKNYVHDYWAKGATYISFDEFVHGESEIDPRIETAMLTIYDRLDMHYNNLALADLADIRLMIAAD